MKAHAHCQIVQHSNLFKGRMNIWITVCPKKGSQRNLFHKTLIKIGKIVTPCARIQTTQNTLFDERIVTLHDPKIHELAPIVSAILQIMVIKLNANATFDSEFPKLSLSQNSIHRFAKVESRHAWRTSLDLWFGKVGVTYILPQNKSENSEETFCYVIHSDLMTS
jgi:hypothetical protein